MRSRQQSGTGRLNRVSDTTNDLDFAKSVIKAMAEDGWMFHGVEGMDETQELVYQAYLKFGLKDACFVYAKRGMKKCPHCVGAGVVPFVGDTE